MHSQSSFDAGAVSPFAVFDSLDALLFPDTLCAPFPTSDACGTGAGSPLFADSDAASSLFACAPLFACACSCACACAFLTYDDVLYDYFHHKIQSVS